MPDFTEEEIGSLLAALGCRDERVSGLWAKITFLQTSGHPKLVHVRALDLRDSGWPSPSARDLATTPESVKGQRTSERLEVARNLQAEERDFLYALTLAGGFFSRGFAIQVGAALALSDPGSAFDRLVGRWVEVQGADSYGVTSLLAGEGTNTLSKEKINRIYGILFDVSIERQPIDISKVFEIFMYAYLGADASRLTHFVLGLLTTDDQVQHHVLRALRPLAYFGTGGEPRVVAFNSSASLFLRVLQFRICAQEKPEALPRVSSQWDWEIAQEPRGQIRDSVRFLWAISISTCLSGSIPPKTGIEALVQLDSLLRQESPVPLPSIELPRELRLGGRAESDEDPITTMFCVFHERCRSTKYLNDLLTALETVDTSLRARMLTAADLPIYNDVRFLVDPVWIEETKNSDPDWHSFLAVMRRTEALSREWKNGTLGLSAARCISIVYDEHLGDRSAASQTLDEAERLFGSSPVIDDQRANICYQHSEFSAALELWERCLAEGDDDQGKLRDPMALRRAALAAGSLGNFRRCAQLFNAGARWAREEGLSGFQAGLLFDAAFAAYKSRDLDLLNSCLSEGLHLIEGKPDPEQDFKAFARQKVAGHIVVWMLEHLQNRGQRNEFEEPLLGLCSRTSFPDAIGKLPASRFELTLAHAIEIEHHLHLPLILLDEFAAAISTCRIPGMRLKVSGVLVQNAFRSRRFDGLMRNLVSFIRAFWELHAQKRLGLDAVDDFVGTAEPVDCTNDLGFQFFIVCALAVHSLDGGSSRTLMERWKNETAIPESISPLLSEVQSFLESDLGASAEILRDQGQKPIRRLCAAFSVLVSPPESPRVTAHAQGAFLLWLIHLPYGDALQECLEFLFGCFSKAWESYLQRPALLQSPRVSVPSLRDALNSNDPAPRKLQLLLEAATFATGVRIPHELDEWLLARS